MGFRFRKSLKLLPGLKVNLTHKGISSVSIGKPGATLNVGKKGSRTTIGLPGTGLSYSRHQPHTQRAHRPSHSLQSSPAPISPGQPSRSNAWWWIGFGVLCFILGALLF